MVDLSVIIPARNEEFLQQTIDNIVANRRAETEVIVILDGYKPKIKKMPWVRYIHRDPAIGQRAGVNLGAKESNAKYIMKLDAHCAVDEGFDVKLMADCKQDWTVIPRMYNLHAFNWRCLKCGHETMQGPPLKICTKCKGSEHEKKIIWEPKWKKRSDFMRFDSDMKFGYWYKYQKRLESKPEIADLMCAIGACFFMERKRFIDLGGMDLKHGGWGQMGVEVACKAWLSGGRHVVNRSTYFSHMFRTNNKGFSFPYQISGKDVQKARKHSRNLWLKNKWKKQIHPLSWLIKKFWPVPGWSEDRLNKLITSDTAAFPASPDPSFVGDSRKQVTSNAVNPPALSIASLKIDGGKNQPQMGGIATRGVLTDDMVNLRNTSALSHGDRFDKPSIHEPMGFKSLVHDSDLAVSVRSGAPLPEPAASHRINGINSDSGKKHINSACGKGGDREILNGSHNSSSNDELGLESERRRIRRSGSNILQNKTQVKEKMKYSNPLLSIIIPARNEKYLQATINDIYKNFTTNFEVIVGLDNYQPNPPLEKHGNLKTINPGKRVGMRPMINRMVKAAKGKYIMKTDAHCLFDPGYDQKLIDMYQPGNTVLGIRYELNVDKWERKERTNCDFRYLSNPDVDKLGGLRGLPWHEYKKTTKGQQIAESMSLSGSGWLMEREQFNRWGGLDENHGTMYQEGAEIACKTWLSGGRLLINRGTWYAHHNRGRAPYALGKFQRQKSIDYSIDFWMNNKWPQQKYSFNWLIDKFKPPGWPAIIHETIPAKKQGTNIKGIKGIFVDELWDKRLGIAEPLKRYRLEIFFNAFDKFLDGDQEAYRNYLISHLSKKPGTVSARGLIRIEKKMKGAERLFKDIKKNGLMAPLEFYQQNGNIVLFRGYRRLVICRKLGFKKVAARVHRNEMVAKQLTPGFAWKRGTITELGARQFAKYGGLSTDKYYVHNYLPMYDNLFAGLRRKRIKILEIGVLHGASLRLWHRAFPKAQIFGLDKNVTAWKRLTKDLDRIEVFVGMQQDEKLLNKVAAAGPYDIIIDDCGHNPDNQWASFTELWLSLNPKGYYIIEDCYRSFQKNHEGFNVPKEVAGWVSSIYEGFEVASIQFYYNICVIQKGV